MEMSGLRIIPVRSQGLLFKLRRDEEENSV